MANINVQYSDMHDAATQLTNGQHQITGDLDRLQGLINNLVNGGFVTDQASKAFDHSYQQFTTGAKQMLEGLGGMGTYLTKAAQAMQDTDTSLANAIKG